MKKTLFSKKLTTLFAAGALVVCMGSQAFAASLTTVEILQPDTPYQSSNPNKVYMDYDDTSDWTTSGDHLEKIAWKFFDDVENPDITTAGNCSIQQYVNNDDSNRLEYAYNFDAGNIDQSLVNTQPYYLGIKVDQLSNTTDLIDMGCRTKFPVAMDVTVHTNFTNGENVTIAYADGSCDGYTKHKATSWSQVQDNNYGDPDYLDGFANTFTTSNATVDADGNVTFTTYHGGEYYIYK
ncbi:hypothetical protein [Anaerovorax odorimutans]|uniref:hypothetical protein n=1 Tax=Anaerovorax odorimutans TaxID=109327 RepID=UPI000400ECD6|nr:hypothetical protein [Anaerovorax odorimutans]